MVGLHPASRFEVTPLGSRPLLFTLMEKGDFPCPPPAASLRSLGDSPVLSLGPQDPWPRPGQSEPMPRLGLEC